MDNKIILILLIATVIISVFSLILTLNLNTEDMQSQERTTTIIKEPDMSSGEVGFAIEPTAKNQNG